MNFMLWLCLMYTNIEMTPKTMPIIDMTFDETLSYPYMLLHAIYVITDANKDSFIIIWLQ